LRKRLKNTIGKKSLKEFLQKKNKMRHKKSTGKLNLYKIRNWGMERDLHTHELIV
jgi:hypothetical protein